MGAFEDLMGSLGDMVKGKVERGADEKRAVYLTKLVGGVLTGLVKKGVLTAEEAREIVAAAKKASES